MTDYLDTLANVEHEKSTSEYIVMRSISASGKSYASQSTKKHDFDGVDIVVINKEDHTEYTIDVKNSRNENRNTTNFLFTVVNGLGKSYITKKTDYIAFLNRDTSLGPNTVEIVYVKFDIIKTIIEKHNLKLYQSKTYKLGKYVLIPKYIARKYGQSRMWSNINVNK